MNTNMNIILDILCHDHEEEYYFLKIFMYIFEYLNIFEYLKKKINPKVSTIYQSEGCE